MSSSSGQSLFVDPKSNVVHYDGSPKLAEEYEERVWLGFQTVAKDDKVSYAAKLKNALFGRAWTLCHRKPEIAAQKLLQLSEAETSANAGPQAAVQLVVNTVRAACEKVAPLLKTQTFEDYFFDKGRRRLGESIQDYISRRESEYEKLTGLTQGRTKLSMHLQAFFLLRNAGVNPSQHRAILGQAGNEYDWDKIVEAMLIQLDGGDEMTGKGWKGSYKSRSQNNYGAGKRGSWAFPIEEEWSSYDGETEEAYAIDEWYGEEPTDDDIPIYEVEEDIQHEIEEMEHAVEIMAVEDLTNEELDVFAATIQKMGKGASEYARKRQAVRDGKTNRGFQPQSSAIGHNKTSIALDGKLTLNAGQLQDKIQQVKARTQCYDCGQKGHWRGDRSCPKSPGSPSSKGGKKGHGKKGGRKGGFLQRAGMAAAMLASASGQLLQSCHEALSCVGLMVDECYDSAFHLEEDHEVIPKLEDYGEVVSEVDAYMTQNHEAEAIPHSLTFMNNTSSGAVPAGRCVVDTAALIGCGGDRTLDKFVERFGSETKLQESNKVLKGVNANAPVMVHHQQWIDIHIAGQKGRVALHRLPNSDVPLLLGLPQLRELGAVIDLTATPKPTIQFTTIGSEKVEMDYGTGGHLLLNIGQGGRNKKSTRLAGETVEVFHQLKAKDFNVETIRIMKGKLRRKVQKMAEEAKEHGRALWKELRRGNRSHAKRVIVKELYSGEDGGVVTALAKDNEMPVGRPRDLLLGDNFLKKEDRDWILAEIKVEKPSLVTMGFNCDPWTPLSNFLDEDTRRVQQEIALDHLDFVRQVCELQISEGRHYLLENPLASQAWKILLEKIEHVPHYTSRMDQCASDLKDINGDFVLKPTRFVTSSPVLASMLTLRCTGDHEHAQVQGRGVKDGKNISSMLGQWTPQLGVMILEGIQRQVLLEEKCGEVKYYLEEEDVYHNALQRSSDVMFRQREEEDLQTWEEVPVLLRSAITKVHRQYSHSLYKENFSRHLRLSGASDQAIKAAFLFTCPTCEKERRSPARPMAAIPKYDHFNQCVAMDIAHIPDQDDVMHSFLLMVDMATSYTLASYLCSGETPGRPKKPQSSQCRKSLVDWMEVFGSPDRVQVDQDGSLRGDFRDLLDRFGIEEILVARDAHWSHGVVERKILTVKEMMMKVAHDSEIKGAILTRVAVVNCVQAINRLSNHRGFSPAQCVLGFQPNLPEIMGDSRGIPKTDHDDHFAMAQRMKLLQDCEHAFVKANHSASLRRALLSQTRQQPGPFDMRSLVMYKRKGLKHKAYKQWHGPARVIGRDLHGYWIIHRGTPILAHPHNMRRAIAEEQELMLEDEGSLLPKNGQQGFLDLSKPQDPIDLEEEKMSMSRRNHQMRTMWGRPRQQVRW